MVCALVFTIPNFGGTDGGNDGGKRLGRHRQLYLAIPLRKSKQREG
jgi:hypothetical protein